MNDEPNEAAGRLNEASDKMGVDSMANKVAWGKGVGIEVDNIGEDNIDAGKMEDRKDGKQVLRKGKLDQLVKNSKKQAAKGNSSFDYVLNHSIQGSASLVWTEYVANNRCVSTNPVLYFVFIEKRNEVSQEENKVDNGVKGRQKQVVIDIGFGKVIDFKIKDIPTRLAYWLVDHFDEESCRLNVKGKEIEITRELVRDVLVLKSEPTFGPFYMILFSENWYMPIVNECDSVSYNQETL
ncbi:hypothetical protein Tco_0996908 [Tanacetum coccineum]